jgi:hypothetical protein
MFLALERRTVSGEGKTAFRRHGADPAPICAANVLTRFPPADVALEELVSER